MPADSAVEVRFEMRLDRGKKPARLIAAVEESA